MPQITSTQHHKTKIDSFKKRKEKNIKNEIKELTLPCFFNRVNVSARPTVGEAVRAAMGVNLLSERVDLWQGSRGRQWACGFFRWTKLVVAFSTAISDSVWQRKRGGCEPATRSSSWREIDGVIFKNLPSGLRLLQVDGENYFIYKKFSTVS